MEIKSQPEVAKHLGELQPTSCEYVSADEILVSMKRGTGEIVTYTLKTAMLVHMVNLSVSVVNNCTAEVFRDLNVF